MNQTIMDQALGAAGLAVLVLDESDRVIDISLPAAKLFGSDPNDLIGMPISAVLPLPTTTTRLLDRTAMMPPGLVIEATARDSAGRVIPVAVNAIGWTDPGGRPRTTILIRDLASEKEVARITQNHLVLSDNAIRGANIGVFEYDPVADSVRVSDIWCRMLEIGHDERLDLQQEWRSRVHPDDLAHALEPINLCAEGHADRASCEYRLHSRDRSRWLWMRTDIAVAQRDTAGRPRLLVGAQTDITERKATEEALRVSVEQFRSAFYNAPIGKAIVGLDGTQLKVNPALCSLLGYSESELVGTRFQGLTHPDDLEEDLRQLNLLIDGKITTYAMKKRYYRANGEIMWGLLSVGLVRDADGNPDHFVSQVVDITEQRRLEELKSEFVSVVSHELRTPLTSILGALTLLEGDDTAELSDEAQRLLFIAKTNGERLHHLVNDILDFQKFSAKQMPFALARCPVAGLVEETLMANLASADRYGVRFAPQIVDRSLTGLVDPKRFHQVMANLLSNATKFATTGSTVEVSVERQDSMIRICIGNVGKGIPDGFRDRVFKPFSQAATVSDRRSGGTGLGLSITKQIVEQMGGEIGFESVPDEKTTFWFTVRSVD